MVIVARSQKSSKPADAVVGWNDLQASADQPVDALDHLLFWLASMRMSRSRTSARLTADMQAPDPLST